MYMLRSGFFDVAEEKLVLKDIRTGVEFDEYMRDLLEYGLGKYDVDFFDAKPEELFHLWTSYRKSQVQQLLLNSPQDIMLGKKSMMGLCIFMLPLSKTPA